MAERPRRKQLADQVAETLQERVLNGEWKPGEKLPTEFDLIEDLKYCASPALNAGARRSS